MTEDEIREEIARMRANHERASNAHDADPDGKVFLYDKGYWLGVAHWLYMGNRREEARKQGR